MPNISALALDFYKRFFKISCKKNFWLPWQPEFFMEFNSLNNLGRASCKKHPCKFQQILPSGLGGEVV
jgi:hypothetical protein